MATPKLPTIPNSGTNVGGLLGTVQALQTAANLLSRNALGDPTAKIFVTTSDLAKINAGLAVLSSVSSAGASAILQPTLSGVSSILAAYQLTTPNVTSAGNYGNLILSLDGSDVAMVPLPIIGAQVYPQIGFYTISQIAAGQHTFAVRAALQSPAGSLSGLALVVAGWLQ